MLFSLVRSALGEKPTLAIDEVVEALKLEIMGAQATEDGSPNRFSNRLGVLIATSVWCTIIVTERIVF